MIETLKPKQQAFLKIFRSLKYTYLCAAGTAGSGKSFLTIGILHLLCLMIPNMRFAIIRKSESNLKKTSIPTYKKIKQITKTRDSSVIVDMTARYENGSEIMFIWADITKDPDLDNVKGLELTGALVEEANQIDVKYFSLLKIRIGRWNNHLCPKFILINLNPSLGWCKDTFYEPWASGTLPEKYFFMEFDQQDAADCSGEDYIDGFLDIPEEERKRYVLNRWDYSEVPNQLIRYEWYKQCVVEDYVIGKTDRPILAIDPAGGNKNGDDTVFGRMHGSHMGWWEEYQDQDPSDSAVLGHTRAIENFIKPDDVVVDAIGVGAGTLSTLKKLYKFSADPFIAGAAASNTSGYLEIFNKRSEGHWLFREALKDEEITITHHPLLQKQALLVQYTTDNKQIKILPKANLAKLIHMSPGLLDVAQMLAHKHFTTEGGLAINVFNRQKTVGPNFGGSSRAVRERAQIIRGNI